MVWSLWCFPPTPKSLAMTVGFFVTGATLFSVGAHLSFINIAPQQARIKARDDYIKQLLKKKFDK